MRITILCLALGTTTLATADVGLKVTDLDSCILEVTYTFNANAGPSDETREFIFPDSGFVFATGPISVKNVFETETGKELAWEVIAAPKNPTFQSVKVFYSHLLSVSGTPTTLIVEAKSANIFKDAEGRYVFKYKTSHRMTFEVPDGHRLVYTNYPVTLYERDGHTYAEVASTERKNVIFKTRAK